MKKKILENNSLPKVEREQTHWYECQIWKKFKQTGASLGNQWGIDRMMELRWCKDPKGNTHLCSWSDRAHEVVRKYETAKRKGKMHGTAYKNARTMTRHLNHDCKKRKCKPYKTTIDKFGNKTEWFR